MEDTSELFRMFVASVEVMKFDQVYTEWCAAGYNDIPFPSGTVTLNPGQKNHPHMEALIKAQLRTHHFDIQNTRKWGDKWDQRQGVMVVDQAGGRAEWGTIPRFRILGSTWVETLVRAQYLLHVLGVPTHFRSPSCSQPSGSSGSSSSSSSSPDTGSGRKLTPPGVGRAA